MAVYDKERVNQIPADLRPVGAWYYFWHNILYSIPVIGFIFLVIHALGGTNNINKIIYARSFFCVFIIVFVILSIVFFTSMASMGWEGIVEWIKTLLHLN